MSKIIPSNMHIPRWVYNVYFLLVLGLLYVVQFAFVGVAQLLFTDRVQFGQLWVLGFMVGVLVYSQKWRQDEAKLPRRRQRTKRSKRKQS